MVDAKLVGSTLSKTESNVRKQSRKTEYRKYASLMESLAIHSTREREREREGKAHKTLFKTL